MSYKNNDRGPNMMRKYVWVVDTILRHGKISFRKLDEEWSDSDLGRGTKLAKRTFDNWRSVISDIFGIDIENENCGEYRYYIDKDNMREFRNDERRAWLYDTISVSNALANSKQIQNRILLEYVPSGQEYLQPIIEAMKKNKVLTLTYYNYWKDEEYTFDVQPYCVKLFRQRWYMIGVPGYAEENLRTYSLDRILELKTTERTFAMPKGWSAESFFKDSFGIFAGSDVKPQRVLLKVNAAQANYIRDLRLHRSQEEIEEEYSIFRYFLRPYYDFTQELLQNGADVEVLEPLWLREEIKKIAEQMWKNYNKKEKKC